jgi:formylglycine-generating enzyme required for sulfatase activity
MSKVYLDAFYMDTYEVTNALYKECVALGGCTQPRNDRSFTRSSYYDNADYRNYPVIYIDWNQAQTYCEWHGGSLPTEAQWEKAARGTDRRSYPWGDQFDGNLLNFCDKNCSFYWREKNSNDGYVDTSPVGNYEDGKSPYGIYDLAGNVWEWVYDWYGESYYQSSPSFNPQGPDTGLYHVVRGGSWNNRGIETNSVVRYTNQDDQYSYNSLNVGNFIGFRCARDANP